jgi:hypothetical protein
VGKIVFSNKIGYTVMSSETVLPVLMVGLPLQPPTNPSRENTVTVGTTMGVTIDALSGIATGGSSILSYNLEYESSGVGSGPWIEVSGFSSDSLLLSHTLTSLTSGSTYCFRYRASNVMGWGPYGFSSRPSNSENSCILGSECSDIMVITSR